jgi:hypothetical protein
MIELEGKAILQAVFIEGSECDLHMRTRNMRTRNMQTRNMQTQKYGNRTIVNLFAYPVLYFQFPCGKGKFHDTCLSARMKGERGWHMANTQINES